MTAQVERSWKSRAPTGDSVALPDVALVCTTVLLVMIGVLSLLEDSRARHVLESWINIHALFALMLLGLLLARYPTCVKRSSPLLPPDIRAWSRHLSRFVYLLMYAVIGISQCIRVVGGMWHGGGRDLHWLDDRLHAPANLANLDLEGDFALLLMTTFVALALVRVMALRLARESTAGTVRE